MTDNISMVSVVIPVYNVVKFLHEAIDSVLGQSYSNWELILIDDGSNDGSGDICDEYAQKDERIRVVHQKNRGVSNARNEGLSLSTGEWVLFLDGDDRLHERALEILLSNAADVDVVICMMKMFPQKIDCRTIDAPIRYATFTDMAPDFEQFHNSHILTSANTKLYRRERIKVRFDEGVRCLEDMLFNIENLPNCRGIRLIPDVLYYYRREMIATLSKKFWKDSLQTRKRALNILLKLFHEHKQVQLIILHRYKIHIMQYVRAIMFIQNISRAEKELLLELYLPDALDVQGLNRVQLKGIDGLLWRCVKTGNVKMILTAFHWYSKFTWKNSKIRAVKF